MARCDIATAISFTLFISFVTCQTIVQVERQEKENITITCNANAVDLSTAFNRIKFVSLLNVIDADANTVQEMAYIQQKDGSSLAITRVGTLPTGWVITLPDDGDLAAELSTLTSNRVSMTIVATKVNVQCSDALQVRCDVQYVSGSSEPEEEVKDTNYTVVGLVSFQGKELFTPQVGNQFMVNDTVQVTCYASGPQSYDFRWQRMCPLISSLVVNWPDASEISHESTLEYVNNLPNDCNTYRHTGRLSFAGQQNYDNCEITCQFGHAEGNGFTESVFGNVTIVLRPEGGPPGGTGASSSASNESLAIGLGVGLTLLVIIIIIILVYVFVFRKRNKDDKYKNDGQDNPDANNLGPNAPPPVFYSKPNKQVKSEKNDARGASIGSEDSYPYEKDIRRKPYFDDENQGLDTDPRGPSRSGRRRSNRRSRGDSVDDSDKEQPRRYPHDGRRSYGDDPRRDDYYDSQPYASTDISRSEDELSDASGRPRPRPKRRTKYTPKDEEEKELHYADLDISQRQTNNNRGDEREERGFENRDPIHYASIRV